VNLEVSRHGAALCFARGEDAKNKQLKDFTKRKSLAWMEDFRQSLRYNIPCSIELHSLSRELVFYFKTKTGSPQLGCPSG
jgi:hypothetical protein